MRRWAWAVVVVGASAGLVGALIGASSLIGGPDGNANAARNVRGWTIADPVAPPPAPAAASTAPPLAVETPDVGASNGPSGSASAGAGAVRDVTPATVTPPPAVSGPLKRLEAPRPNAPPPEPWRDVLFHRPWIGSDLSLAVRPSGAAAASGPRVEIRLAGISPLDENAVCKDALGDEGPCRTVAAAALRALIGAKGIECQSPRKALPPRLTTTCRLGNRDLGAWLVERGYARGASPAAVTAAPANAN